jgi:hypothetical protein
MTNDPKVLPLRRLIFLCTISACAGLASAQAQRDPHIGYLFPAGGQRGTELEVTVGGQFLDGARDVHVSGPGIQATVVAHTKPLTQQQINELAEKMREIQRRVQAARRSGRLPRGTTDLQAAVRAAAEVGVSEQQIRDFLELRKRLADPKRQLNPQLAETVTLHVRLADDAPPGLREIRLITAGGLSNPLKFAIGTSPEYQEQEPNDTAADPAVPAELPVVLNGQIMPGDVDRFRFQARQGQQLVVDVDARRLMPYLADAVPGWFQATLTLYDDAGVEVAYADDHRFDPDPVIAWEIPEDGAYVVEIKDAVYRGREDFVYRIVLGELPFVTGVFPLGGRVGQQIDVDLQGWNLPQDSLTIDGTRQQPGVQLLSAPAKFNLPGGVPFRFDDVPECLEQEPNDRYPEAQQIVLPAIVNGRIGRAGDRDTFCFRAVAGQQVVAEVYARRLGSPLDSLLVLTDQDGRQLAADDDTQDAACGLTTHHADSRLQVTLPADGVYCVQLADAQQAAGEAYAYRLRISAPRPDYQLRVVPSGINAVAGGSTEITVHALRRDGFAGDIQLSLQDAPEGVRLSGGWIPAGQDAGRMTLSMPLDAPQSPFRLRIEGNAQIQGQHVQRTAVPADDVMQAFIYRHLVPADELLVAVNGPPRYRARLALLEQAPIRLVPGGTAQAALFAPPRLPLDQVRFALSDGPEGISIQDVASHRFGLSITFASDAAAVQPGLRGNLIVAAYTERPILGPDGKPRANSRRIPLGILPAIPFEVVDDAAVDE